MKATKKTKVAKVPKVDVYDITEVMPSPANKAEAAKAVASLLARADVLRAERKAKGENRSNYGGQQKLRQLAHTYRRIAAKFGISEQLPEFHAQAAKKAS
jgi:hypothetical protein